MLVSVTERTREIGVRMAVGAHGRDILTQFLIEAVALERAWAVSSASSLGIVASKIISMVKNWPTVISPLWIADRFLVSAAVGIFFGFYPAREASRSIRSMRCATNSCRS